MKGFEFFTQPFKRSFDFKGRAGRQEFWLYILCIAVVLAAASFIIMAATITSCTILYSDMGAQQGCGWIGTFICMLLSVFGLPLMMMAVGARRLHDSNKSGWWQLLLLIPSLGILALFILMLLPGTKGENRFGPPPQA